jgi:hypothetical protein
MFENIITTWSWNVVIFPYDENILKLLLVSECMIPEYIVMFWTSMLHYINLNSTYIQSSDMIRVYTVIVMLCNSVLYNPE